MRWWCRQVGDKLGICFLLLSAQQTDDDSICYHGHSMVIGDGQEKTQHVGVIFHEMEKMVEFIRQSICTLIKSVDWIK